MKKRLFGLLLVVLLAGCSRAETLIGRVVRVHDGDTITILDARNREYRVRFQAVDAPEKNQDFGNVSRKYLNSLIYGKTVRVEIDKIDKHGRTVGRVFLGETDVERKMLEAGLVWHYKYFNHEPVLAEAERLARLQKRGIWSMSNPVPPWEYRRGERPQKSEQTSYWVSEENVLHNSSCRFYEKSRGAYSSGQGNYRDCQKCGGRHPQ